jgi:hypothetical protein
MVIALGIVGVHPPERLLRDGVGTFGLRPAPSRFPITRYR